MGGTNADFEAPTISELKKMTQEWTRLQREAGFEVHHGWNRDRVQKTEDGTYRISVHAHT